MSAPTIRTSFEHPPIPIRSLDWCAWVDGTEGEDMVQGWGRTESAAIADLMERLDEA